MKMRLLSHDPRSSRANSLEGKGEKTSDNEIENTFIENYCVRHLYCLRPLSANVFVLRRV